MTSPHSERPLFIPGAPEPRLLTPKQAGYLLGIDEADVRALVKSGMLETVKLGSGRYHHIKLASVNKFAGYSEPGTE